MAKCDNCGGNAAKKLSLINREGRSSGNAAGIGIGTGGVGIGAGKTSNITSLASDAAYVSPESLIEKFFTYACVALFIGLFLFTDNWVAAIGLPLLLIIIFGFLKASGVIDKSGVAEEEIARSQWENTWMCTDCGDQWIDFP